MSKKATALDIKFIAILERGGRRFESRVKGRWHTVYLWKGEEIVCMGVSSTNMHDALVRLIKWYVRENPVCEMATQFERFQQRANKKLIKQLLKIPFP